MSQGPESEASTDRCDTPVAPTRPSGTITLFFSDIEGSTRLWEEAPDAMARALKRHDEIVRSAIESSGGYVFKTVGDAFCAAFPTATEAVQAAELSQRALAAEPWPKDSVLRVRIALHTGECVERDGDYYGQTVNRVARLEDTAHGGQVVLSQSTADLVRDHLPAGADLRELGTHHLKDLSHPEEVFQFVLDGLRDEFPPLRSLDNTALSNNLPQLASSFVGRGTELADVRTLVGQSRLVTLTGAGGAGKTRLALQVAAELLDGSGDGVWLVQLAAVTDPDAVAATVASALGLSEQPDRQALDTLLDVLAGQRRLVLLDNCEHLVAECAKLADAIVRGCPNIHILATSREPLGIDGEHVYRIPPLSLPPEDAVRESDLVGSESVSLFVERAAAQGTGFVLSDANSALVAAVCRSLDGMPLAIELAAARVRSMSITSLHERLEQRFHLLTGGSRNALPRHQTLRGMVDWSYDMLTPIEQALFRRLSVFCGGFELEAAEGVCGFGDADSFEVADLLGGLVDKSLVSIEVSGVTNRHRLLETIRHYSAERLEQLDDGLEAARARDAHAAYYVARAEEVAPHLVGPAQDLWLARLEGDYSNLRAAAEHLLDTGEGSEALRLFATPRRNWWHSSHGADILGLLDRALELAGEDAPAQTRAEALACRTHLLYFSDLLSQEASAHEALDAARRAGDRALEAEILGFLCFNACSRGAPMDGIEPGGEAVAIARQLGDPVLLGMALKYYVIAVEGSGNPGAESIYREALSVVTQSGDAITATGLHSNYGGLLLDEGRVAEARRQFEMALAVTPASRGKGSVINWLGWVMLGEGDTAAAVTHFTNALLTARRSGDQPLCADIILGLAGCSIQAGDPERAVILHGGASALQEACGAAWQTRQAEDRENEIAVLRDRVGSAFENLYETGRAMRRDDVVDLALDRSDRFG